MGNRDQVCQPVELLRPTASRKDLLDLIRLQLERVKLPGEVTDVTVRATVVAPLVYRQADLFGGRVGAQRPPDVSGLIERLSSRLGNAAVLRPRLVPDERLPRLRAPEDLGRELPAGVALDAGVVHEQLARGVLDDGKLPSRHPLDLTL